MSVSSVIEAGQFLLQHQMRSILNERFYQDTLENYFKQCSLGAWKENPSLKDFG